jgi:hypothetical protein
MVHLFSKYIVFLIVLISNFDKSYRDHLDSIYNRSQKIDLTQRKFQKFELEGKNLIFNNSSGEIFFKQNDSVIEIKQKDICPNRVSSTLFKFNDTIFRYGGYGFYSTRNFIEYYDKKINRWTYYRTNGSYSPKGSFYGFSFSNSSSVFLFGGKNIDFDDGIGQINNSEVLELDFENNRLKFIGNTDFDFNQKRYLCEFDNGIFLYDLSKVYELNFKKLKIIEYEKSLFITDLNYSNIYRKISNDTLEYYSFDEDERTLIKVGQNEISKKIISNRDLILKPYPYYFQLFSIILIIIIVIYLAYVRIKKKITLLEGNYLVHNGRKYQFDKKNVELLRNIISSNSISFLDLLKIFENQNLTYSQNTRIINDEIKKISIRLKDILDLKNNPLEFIKSDKDKRFKILSSSFEFQKVKIKCLE